MRVSYSDGLLASLSKIVSMRADPADVQFLFVAQYKTEPARLIAAFDAAGKESQSYLAVAGFISNAKDWQAFHEAWMKRLEQDGLTHFRMADFAASQGQFKTGWRDDEPRRQNLLGDLVGIIKSHVYNKFGSIVENNEFRHLSEDNQKEFALNAYSLAGRACAGDVSAWISENGLAHVPTGYVFEEGDAGAGLLVRRMSEDGYPIPVFKPKKDRTGTDGALIEGYTPLQAADILAYEMGKAARDLDSGRWLGKFRWAFAELERIPGILGYYSPKDLRQLNEKLDEISMRDRARFERGDALPSES